MSSLVQEVTRLAKTRLGVQEAIWVARCNKRRKSPQQWIISINTFQKLVQFLDNLRNLVSPKESDQTTNRTNLTTDTLNSFIKLPTTDRLATATLWELLSDLTN